MGGEIGKPNDWSPGELSVDPDYGSGGFTEERLAKLEYQQRELMNDMLNIKTGYCLCCKEPMSLAFPICQDCVETLGKITIAKRNLKFLA